MKVYIVLLTVGYQLKLNYSHTYQIGSQCPFDYCLPYSSDLNLSDRDSQCQFKRSGLLCGQCQQDYSSIFGSS